LRDCQYRTHWGLRGFQTFLRQRPKRAAWCLNSGLVRPSISQALADDALCQVLGAHRVIDAQRNAVVVAEIELGQVTMQVLFLAMLIRSPLNTGRFFSQS